MVCPAGYLCKTPGEIQKCPSGYYCPTGTFEARPCDTLSLCPEGTTAQVSLNGIVAFIVIDVFLLITYLWLIKKDQIKAALCKKKDLNIDPSFPSISTVDTLAKNSDLKTKLAGNFKKSFHDTDLKMHFEMDHLGLTLSNGKEILKGVTGHIHAGRMTAIMGPSGYLKLDYYKYLKSIVLGKLPFLMSCAVKSIEHMESSRFQAKNAKCTHSRKSVGLFLKMMSCIVA